MRHLVTAALAGIIAAAVPAAAAQSGPSLLELQSKVVMTGKPLRVIVTFDRGGAGTAPTGASGRAADAFETEANRTVQAEILNRAFGVDHASTRAGTVPVKLMDFEPMMALTTNAAGLARLAADPRVVRIVEDEALPPLMNDVVKIVGMTGKSGGWSKKATGSGRAVAVMDTGIIRNHEFLRGRVISEACFSTTLKGTSKSLCRKGRSSDLGTGAAAECSSKINGCGHGTHVAGTAAGNNKGFNVGEPRFGIARNAGIVGIKVFSRFGSPGNFEVRAFTSDIVKGLERVFALRRGVNGRKIDAVNMSLGGGQFTDFCPGDATAGIIGRLRKAGIATVIASGNNGFTSSVASPACVKTAITVGSSSKRSNTGVERVASYSNMGKQVDVLAPGGDFQFPFFFSDTGMINSSYFGGYEALQGTSMAAPAVAGAIVAVRSRAACRNKTVAQIESALKRSGKSIRDHRFGPQLARKRMSVPALMKRLGCG